MAATESAGAGSTTAATAVVEAAGDDLLPVAGLATGALLSERAVLGDFMPRLREDWLPGPPPGEPMPLEVDGTVRAEAEIGDRPATAGERSVLEPDGLPTLALDSKRLGRPVLSGELAALVMGAWAGAGVTAWAPGSGWDCTPSSVVGFAGVASPRADWLPVVGAGSLESAGVAFAAGSFGCGSIVVGLSIRGVCR